MGITREITNAFSDVLAFDATYGKNKYSLPLVVYSGVNHHNQSVIFASALIANETEETYIWLLEQFLVVMKGKQPLLVITNGDNAMKNAISKVFLDAYHRLCSWHLSRNANTNIKNRSFVMEFEQLMYGEYNIGEFGRKWTELVARHGLENNVWVNSMYEKRKMSYVHMLFGLQHTFAVNSLLVLEQLHVVRGYI
uniref:MULE transposase domain-containing protein n=1 Tax=Cyamopsis tetragonoloba TaxID=3832 RepID=A0A9E8AA95_CYATE|nr:hypothetical protein [Cyamopsis tetragonoloba]